MESIPPGEIFGNATLNQSPPRQHVDPNHRDCAYYLEGDDGAWLMCPHGVLPLELRSAFYSEDYVRELKLAAQQVIGELDYDGPPLHQRIGMTEAIEKLRKLTE